MDTWIMTRKRFMDAVLAAGAACVAFVVAYPLLRFVNPPKRSSEAGEWIDAGTLSDLPKLPQSKAMMSSGGIPLILFHRGEKDVAALEKKCPHLGCMVDVEPNQIHCPCHGATFTLEGVRTGGPAPRNLKRFAVEVRPDGHVYVGKEITS